MKNACVLFQVPINSSVLNTLLVNKLESKTTWYIYLQRNAAQKYISRTVICRHATWLWTQTALIPAILGLVNGRHTSRACRHRYGICRHRPYVPVSKQKIFLWRGVLIYKNTEKIRCYGFIYPKSFEAQLLLLWIIIPRYIEIWHLTICYKRRGALLFRGFGKKPWFNFHIMF